MAKQLKFDNYICLVDTYRRPSRCRNTRGRYRVGAKSPEEAKTLLHKKIGFGSILVYRKCQEESDRKANRFIAYKEIVRENSTVIDGKMVVQYLPAHHATDPVASYHDAKPIATFPI